MTALTTIQGWELLPADAQKAARLAKEVRSLVKVAEAHVPELLRLEAQTDQEFYAEWRANGLQHAFPDASRPRSINFLRGKLMPAKRRLERIEDQSRALLTQELKDAFDSWAAAWAPKQQS